MGRVTGRGRPNVSLARPKRREISKMLRIFLEPTICGSMKIIIYQIPDGPNRGRAPPSSRADCGVARRKQRDLPGDRRRPWRGGGAIRRHQAANGVQAISPAAGPWRRRTRLGSAAQWDAHLQTGPGPMGPPVGEPPRDFPEPAYGCATGSRKPVRWR